jgi:2-desacetyl-2-hydroxyethyl bacteriochlorophyllide A dehydrogenase
MSTAAPSLFLDRSLALSVGVRELPDPAPGEALIRVEWAGLCGSDLHVMRTGAWVTVWPATLGHEIFGRVEAVGGDAELAPGTAVVADSRLPCGACPRCAVDPLTCGDVAFVGEARPGGFASHCVLPTSLLHAVPETLEGSTAVLAEPLAVVLHGLAHVRETPARAAILGHGPIGALVHVELRRRFPSVEVDVAEPAPLRAALARALGAPTVADAAELAAGTYDLVVDAAGFPSSLAHAVTRCATGAQILLLALSDHPVPITPMELVERRVTVTGSNAFVDELPAAIALLAAEGWRYEALVTDAVALDELPAAARRQLERPDAVKVLVRP